jgi:periplasmic divalent cation tolerance protein
MDDPDALIAVVTTTATRDEAQRLATALVERRLVACAQLSDIESLYRWQGAVQQASECRLVLKTTAGRYAAVEAAIRALHAYQLPAIFALPVTQAFEDYAGWVREETR